MVRYNIKTLAKELNISERKTRRILRESKVQKDKYYWDFTEEDIELIRNTIKRGMQ